MFLPTDIANIYLRDPQQGSKVVTQTVTVTQPAQTVTITAGASQKAEISGDHGTGGLTSVQFGAILGVICSLVVIGIAAGICLSSNKKSKVRQKYYTTATSSSSGSSRRRHRRRNRSPPTMVPGGPKYPTYRAIPISKPTNPPVAHTK
ncbi:hypothetical protein VFPPC_02429 [Pochonia chlamydosporia 170]|uniref:Uncharacterized protein n=1 Tax=Pochonia chlamydosporia 170 TaxID=1380566 RepID=A0A179FXE9_METCM|nr:hypothetical protein VFPPC_02429 [Pochonia chlamydosporia 170]OAQ69860.1 hypothetical protein VFPPC_02429 [Pochonia chlamydosporia 170]